MIINSYLSYSLIAYLISLPITVYSMKYFSYNIGSKFNVALPFIFSPYQAVIGLVIIFAIFLIVTANAKRKINKISLQEVLKAYRE